ncbi:MAG: metal-sulfur cluster assembly factor [Nitrospirota bacterium]
MATVDEVRNALRQVIDPEIGHNLVDLGLIYGIDVEDDRVGVTMTFSTPGCPMHDVLVTGVERVVRALPGVSKVDVRVVWDPPWHPGMMADSVRKALGR